MDVQGALPLGPVSKDKRSPDAVFSHDLEYRYFLSRNWNDALPPIAFIGLNPSTADATNDDPTIRRCISFAKAWGGGSLWMVNLFGFRSTDPNVLTSLQDPVGAENDHWISHSVQHARLVVAAWGNKGGLLNRSNLIIDRHGAKLKALQITKLGMPKHPLYVHRSTIPVAFLKNGSLV